MKSILKTLIRLYMLILSPVLGQNCRFHPTCSNYAYQAIDEHGVLKGLSLAIKRIAKCHPFYKGKFIDPVPPHNPSEKVN